MKVAGTGCIVNSGRDILIDTVANNEDFNFTKFYVSEFSDSFADLVNPAIYEDFPKEKLVAALASSTTFSGDVTPGTNVVTGGGSTILPISIKLLANSIPYDISINTVFVLAEDLRGARIELADTTNFEVGNTVTSGTTTGIITYVGSGYIIVNSILDGVVDGTYSDFTNGSAISSNKPVTPGSTTISSTPVVSEIVIYSGCVSYDEELDINVNTPANFNVGQYVVNDAGTPARAEITGKSGSTLTLSRVNTENFSLGDNLEEVPDTTTAYSSSDGVTTSEESTNLTTSSVLPFVYNADGAVNLFKINLRFSSGFPTNLNFLNTAVQEIEEHDVSASSHATTHLALGGTNSPTTDIDWDDNKIENLAIGTVSTDAANCGVVQTYSTDTLTGATFAQAQAYIDALPKRLNHDFTLNINASSTGFDSGVALVIEGFHGKGIININGSGLLTELTGLQILNCDCKVDIYNLTDFVDDTTNYASLYIKNSRNVYVHGNLFNNCTNIALIDENSYVLFDGNFHGVSITNGITVIDGSEIVTGGWQSYLTNTITNKAYYCDSGIVRLKDINQPTVAGSDYFETINGGQLVGILGSGRNDTDVTYNVNTAAKYTNSEQTLKLFGPEVPEGMTFDINLTGETGANLIVDGFHGSGKIVITGNGSTNTKNQIKVLNCDCDVEIDNVFFATTGTTSLHIENCKNVILYDSAFRSNNHTHTIEIINSKFTNETNLVSNSINSTVSAHTIFMKVDNSKIVSGPWNQNADTDITGLVFDIYSGGRVIISDENQPYASAGSFSKITNGGDIIGLLGRNQSGPVTITIPISSTTDIEQASINKIFNAYGREIPAGTKFVLDMANATFNLTAQAVETTIGSVYGAGTLELTGDSLNSLISGYGLIFDNIMCKLEINAMGFDTVANNGLSCINCENVVITDITSDNATTAGVNFQKCPLVIISSCIIWDCLAAILGEKNSNIYSYGNGNGGGTANTNDFVAYSGAKIAKGADATSNPLSTSSTAVASGGMIISNTGTVITT